ncbi:hypothetical protein HanRHA438_Chr14g0668551 [Helianthus annuus]|nr:hypothetical protein HanRHA438_Chr14g0668551 [Helianthus annuus]
MSSWLYETLAAAGFGGYLTLSTTAGSRGSEYHQQPLTPRNPSRRRIWWLI